MFYVLLKPFSRMFLNTHHTHGRDVQRQIAANNVDRSSFRAPWQNGSYKNSRQNFKLNLSTTKYIYANATTYCLNSEKVNICKWQRIILTAHGGWISSTIYQPVAPHIAWDCLGTRGSYFITPSSKYSLRGNISL